MSFFQKIHNDNMKYYGFHTLIVFTTALIFGLFMGDKFPDIIFRITFVMFFALPIVFMYGGDRNKVKVIKYE